MTDDCQAYLLRRYEGEVYGEALFASLAAVASDADRRKKWRVLARLERETKERIVCALERAAIAVPVLSESVQRGERDGRRLSGVVWRDLMQGFRRELERFVTEFQRSEELGVSGDVQDLLRHITNHERALLEFVIRELDGRPADSLQPVLGLLGDPDVP